MNSQDHKDGVDSATGGREDHGQANGFRDLKEQQPHHSVGFWHPRMSKVRRHVILLWFRTGKSSAAFLFATDGHMNLMRTL